MRIYNCLKNSKILKKYCRRCVMFHKVRGLHRATLLKNKKCCGFVREFDLPIRNTFFSRTALSDCFHSLHMTNVLTFCK